MNPTEVIEKALIRDLRLRLGKRALTDAMLDKPIRLSGGEAEEAARIAVDALKEAGLLAGEGQVVVSAEVHRELLALIEEFADPSPCEFDHDGGCQAHGPTSTWSGCPHARAGELLAALPERIENG